MFQPPNGRLGITRPLASAAQPPAKSSALFWGLNWRFVRFLAECLGLGLLLVGRVGCLSHRLRFLSRFFFGRLGRCFAY